MLTGNVYIIVKKVIIELQNEQAPFALVHLQKKCRQNFIFALGHVSGKYSLLGHVLASGLYTSKQKVVLTLEALGDGGGGVKLTPLDFLALNFCSWTDC